MTDTTTATEATAPETTGTPDPAPAAPKSHVVPPTPKPSTLPDDTEALKAEIAKLREENAKARTNAKAQAAEDAKKELAQQIGKALGIVDADEVDPAQLTAQAAAAQAAQQDTARELAVFKAAAQHNADAGRLLDSRSFLTSIAELDPSDADGINDAIKKAVADNPTFKTTPTPGASAVDHAGGSGEGAVTPEQFKAMNYEQRVALYESNRALYDQLAGHAG